MTVRVPQEEEVPTSGNTHVVVDDSLQKSLSSLHIDFNDVTDVTDITDITEFTDCTENHTESDTENDDEVSTSENKNAQVNVDTKLKKPLPTLHSALPESDAKNAWSEPNGNVFRVRGKNYLNDRKKIQSDGNIFKTRGVDLLLSDDWGPTEIGRQHPGVLGGRLRDAPTFIVNFRFSWGVLVLYFEIPSKYLPFLRKKYNDSSKDSQNTELEPNASDSLSPHDKAIRDFLMGNDASKNLKLKLIPHVVKGNVIVRKLVGKPVIIGNKLPVTYFYEPEDPVSGMSPFLEADLDIGSSSTRAKKIIDVLRKYMSSVTVDIGFVLQGDSEEFLPERILASARVHHVDPRESATL